MEKHEGIVFLATNRAYDLDEAMHRRITMVIEYSLPDKYRRKVIWDNLLGEMTTPWVEAKEGMEIDSNSKKDETNLSSSHVQTDVAIASASTIPTRIFLSPLVDTSILAQKYFLTGGFIKNAVLSAILMALSRVNNNANYNSISDQNAPTISQQDLITACQLQMRGNLYQKTFEHKVPSPQQTLEGLYGNSSDLQTLQKVIKYEQTREKVYGSWSVFTSEGSVGAAGTSAGTEASSTSSSSSVIQQDKLTEKANIVLLAGVHGSGKFTIVESVANALGIKALKVLHIGKYLIIYRGV
jgi:SpoVK/Ycf46/Vps4 family AAA+-type ATPase